MMKSSTVTRPKDGPTQWMAAHLSPRADENACNSPKTELRDRVALVVLVVGEDEHAKVDCQRQSVVNLL